MWNDALVDKKENKKHIHCLSKEILGIFCISFLISIFAFWILNEAANVILFKYVEAEMLVISEYQIIDLQYWILGISFLSGIILFIIFFLFLTGERLAYIGEIENGIYAFGRHEWEYEIPLRGKNELTELAKLVNALSKEEKILREKEKRLQDEKINLMRSLSHDIRTPLTSVMSYSEFMKQKEDFTIEEMKAYMELVEQKSQQIKVLTDRLLNGGRRTLEVIENGRFLMEQLVDEWVSELEEDYECQIQLEQCPQFSGEFDIEELRRIFDNLTSNVRKYADETEIVFLELLEADGRVCIYQTNKSKASRVSVESTRIGVSNIRKIAENYGGKVQLSQTEDMFSIRITLMNVKKESLEFL